MPVGRRNAILESDLNVESCRLPRSCKLIVRVHGLLAGAVLVSESVMFLLSLHIEIDKVFSFVRLLLSLLVYIGVGVAAGIILILIVLVVAYFVMKSKK